MVEIVNLWDIGLKQRNQDILAKSNVNKNRISLTW